MNTDSEFKPYKHDNFGDHYKHPTFGTIAFARGQGAGRPLFGSSVLHSESISLHIKHAELSRDLHKDWIFGGDIIIEVEMSPTQFVDAITGLNMGSDVPVTIRYIRGEPAQNLSHTNPPYQNKVEQFNTEFDNKIKNIGKRFDETIALANKTKAQKRLIFEIEQLKMWFVSNIPFVNKQFSEQMENTVKEAKGEVEAFVIGMVQSYGIEAIRKQAPQLPETKQITEGKLISEKEVKDAEP